MSNQTADIEHAILTFLDNGPCTLDDLLTHLSWVNDRRWVGVAMMHLDRGGRVRHVTCDFNHNHDSGCMVEVVR